MDRERYGTFQGFHVKISAVWSMVNKRAHIVKRYMPIWAPSDPLLYLQANSIQYILFYFHSKLSAIAKSRSDK